MRDAMSIKYIASYKNTKNTSKNMKCFENYTK